MQLDDDFAGVGGDAQYWRVNSEARGYYPVTEKITLVGRVIGGRIQGWGGEDVRLLDTFFKGGETIRGFDRAGYGPRDLSSRDNKMRWAARPTGPLRPRFASRCPTCRTILASAARFSQMRVRCLMRRAARKSALAAALVLVKRHSPALADSSSIRSSVGASLMWNSPVGPIRMDFAKVITKESFDQTQFFRFGASTKF